MEKNESEKFVEWFNSRLEKNESLTFGDVSKKFDCSFEYVEEDVFLHFNDDSKAVFVWRDQKETFVPFTFN
jgi:hypothetical protein